MNTLQKYGKPPISLLAGALPLPLLIKMTGQKLFLPFYHTVSDNKLPHIQHLYPVRNTKQFENDLDYLLRYFKPIDSDTLIRIVNGEERPASCSFFLSFDDGLQEIYDVIAPILLKKGIPAAFFINSGFVDNKALFYRYKESLLIDRIINGKLKTAEIAKANQFLNNTSTDLKKAILSVPYSSKNLLDDIAEAWQVDYRAFLLKEQPYVTTHQCTELKNKGFSIGAHSIDHPFYNSIPLGEQLRQTRESLKWVLENNLNDKRLFAFPFTDYNVSKAFFDTVFDDRNPLANLSFGGAGLKKDYKMQHLQRFPMEGTLDTAQKLISGEYLYYLLKMPFHKNKITRV